MFGLISDPTTGNNCTWLDYAWSLSISTLYIYDTNLLLDNIRLEASNSQGTALSCDAASRVTEQVSYSSPGVVSERRANTYNANGWLTQQDIKNGADTLTQRITYSAYDALGNVKTYQVQVLTGTAYTNTYTTTYAKFDGYKEEKQAGSSTYFQAGATTSSYDVNGNITAVSETFATSKNRSFVTNAAGQILQKTENGKTQNYFYANDKPLGSSGALGAADFDYNYTPVSAQYPASTPGSYVVSAGDTLRGIALAVFGDAQLWYLIADANGLKSDADLTAGRNLTIPNKVTNLRNAADTYKPYAPGAIIGDTTPTLPDPPPPPPVYSSSGGGGGCGGFGAILVAIIVIVVAVYTGQEWLAEYGVEAMTATQCTGSYTLASYAAAAAVGSVAGQAVAMALGAQESFSWKGVALAALSAGVGGALPGGEAFGEGIGGTIARAATSSLITQGVSVATGMQEQFSWSGVAATAIGAGLNAGLANSGVGQTLKQSFGDIGGNRLVGTLANGAAHALVFGGKANWTSVAADVFGNVIANELGYRATAVGNAEQVPLSYGGGNPDRDFVENATRLYGNAGSDSASTIRASALASQVLGETMDDTGLPYGEGDQVAAGNRGTIVGMEITAKRGDPLAQTASLIYAKDFASDVQQRQQQYAAFLGTAGSGDDPLIGIGFSQNVLNTISAGLATRAQIDGPINPQAENLYRPAESVLGNLYRDSYRNAFDTSRTLIERVGYGAGAIAAALPGLTNDIVVGAVNSVNNLWTGAQEMTFGIHAGDPYRFAGGLGRASDGLLNFAGVAAMIPRGGAVGAVGEVANSAVTETSSLTSKIQKTFQDGEATRIVLDEPLSVTRFHGGSTGKIGRFATTDIFDSRVAVRDDLAILQEWGNGLTKRTTVELPAGTTIWVGKAAPQVGKNGVTLPGGGSQVYIDGVGGKLNADWFASTDWFRSYRGKN